jgi:hypothetical protein
MLAFTRVSRKIDRSEHRCAAIEEWDRARSTWYERNRRGSSSNEDLLARFEGQRLW